MKTFYFIIARVIFFYFLSFAISLPDMSYKDFSKETSISRDKTLRYLTWDQKWK